jgi:hypothetical protein
MEKASVGDQWVEEVKGRTHLAANEKGRKEGQHAVRPIKGFWHQKSRVPNTTFPPTRSSAGHRPRHPSTARVRLLLSRVSGPVRALLSEIGDFDESIIDGSIMSAWNLYE